MDWEPKTEYWGDLVVKAISQRGVDAGRQRSVDAGRRQPQPPALDEEDNDKDSSDNDTSDERDQREDDDQPAEEEPKDRFTLSEEDEKSTQPTPSIPFSRIGDFQLRLIALDFHLQWASLLVDPGSRPLLLMPDPAPSLPAELRKVLSTPQPIALTPQDVVVNTLLSSGS